jgi:hypothetical protein
MQINLLSALIWRVAQIIGFLMQSATPIQLNVDSLFHCHKKVIELRNEMAT